MPKPLKPENATHLVVHCTATRCDHEFTVDSLIDTGIERFGQPSYHYYVRCDGEIVPILSKSLQGIHAVGFNRSSIAICYEGGLDIHGKAADTRTPKQKASLYQLLKDLRKDYPKDHIVGHRELPRTHKDCPCFIASKEY